VGIILAALAGPWKNINNKSPKMKNKFLYFIYTQITTILHIVTEFTQYGLCSGGDQSEIPN
jgi:hypothetical protein